MLITLVIAVVVLIGVGAHQAVQTQQGNANCSPAPCGDDGNGFQVFVDSLDRNVGTSNPYATPGPGNHYVRVTVHFKNTGSAEGSANPFSFVLQDAAGVKHTYDAGQSIADSATCPAFAAVNVTQGASTGEVTLCFEASGAPQGALTLVWTPGLHDIDIDLSGARAGTSRPVAT